MHTLETTGPEADLIRATERKRLRALVDADLEVATPLHSLDFQLIHPGGGTLSRDEYLGLVASGALRYVVWEPISEIEVRFYGTAAAIRYQARAKVNSGGQEFHDHLWHTDLYEKRAGRWQVVWSQATRTI